MTREERRALLAVGMVTAIVFAFLAGYLVAEAPWFEGPRKALFSFLESITGWLRTEPSGAGLIMTSLVR